MILSDEQKQALRFWCVFSTDTLCVAEYMYQNLLKLLQEDINLFKKIYENTPLLRKEQDSYSTIYKDTIAKVRFVRDL